MPAHTAAHVNQRLRRATEIDVARTAAAGPEAIALERRASGYCGGVTRVMDGRVVTRPAG